MLDLVLRIFVGFLPVLLFLACLIYLDSYKLVGLRTVLITLIVGGITAGASYLANTELMGRLALELRTYSRYVAPIVEETFKALVLVFFLRTNRIGFLVDAAIFGFAVGTGFSVIENIYYLGTLPDAHIAVWIIRGFGTAIMHGGTAAIFGIASKTFAERLGSKSLIALLPGLLLAMATHSFFNHFFFSPMFSTLSVLLLLPPMISLVFRQSEKSVEGWLGVGFDADTELLELINSGQFSDSKVGQYLHTLKERFSGEVIVDLLCYLRLHVELSLRAKGELMLRESGFKTEVDPEVRAKFEEMRYLENSVGKTGKLAILPFLRVSDKDLWQLYMLGQR